MEMNVRDVIAESGYNMYFLFGRKTSKKEVFVYCFVNYQGDMINVSADVCDIIKQYHDEVMDCLIFKYDYELKDSFRVDAWVAQRLSERLFGSPNSIRPMRFRFSRVNIHAKETGTK